MPKRNDLHCVLLIGSGPIIIGQACEFDYSGSQRRYQNCTYQLQSRYDYDRPFHGGCGLSQTPYY